MTRLVVASGNAGKLRELQALLADSGIECIPQAALGVTDIEETGLSFVENALLKARHATRVTGLPALADDSGLCVDALDGAPGLYSARYAGALGDATGGPPPSGRAMDAANVGKLLAALDGVPDARRDARFCCVLALLRHPHDPQPLLAEGRWEGRILHAPRGDHGFGYDPVFLDPASGLSAAELAPADKHLVSHRGQALAALRDRLLAECGRKT
ncbi:RdgB/HAM1 family non-canonical purine NTP pyrophosphatase [soil metagenome]